MKYTLPADPGSLMYLQPGGIKMGGLLYTIIAVLFVLWLLGFLAHFGGGLIHLLLVVAVVLFIVNLLMGRRTV
jgi:hypothetical protein